MANVWIVIETTSHPDYSSDGPGFYDTKCVYGAFSSKENAERSVKKQKAKFDRGVWAPEYDIEEHEVDA